MTSTPYPPPYYQRSISNGSSTWLKRDGTAGTLRGSGALANPTPPRGDLDPGGSAGCAGQSRHAPAWCVGGSGGQGKDRHGTRPRRPDHHPQPKTRQWPQRLHSLICARKKIARHVPCRRNHGHCIIKDMFRFNVLDLYKSHDSKTSKTAGTLIKVPCSSDKGLYISRLSVRQRTP